jgi:Spy/CpxP family protein refolding chaperone
MKKTLTTGLMVVLSAAVLSACGSSGALNAAGLGGSDNAFSQLSLENSDSASPGKGFGYKKQGPMGFQKGLQGPGPGFALGFWGDLSLTDAQKTEIQGIMEAAKANQPARPTATERPTPPDAAAIRAAQDAIHDKISAAFVSDSFDADALHAEMKSLHPEPNPRPDPAAMELAHAQQTLDLWNVLTAEQKTTVTTKSAEFADKMTAMEAKRPEKANKRPEQGLALFTEKLSLTADQQAALTAAFEANRPAAPAKPDPQALITLLNSGSATAESIAALHTRPQQLDHNPLKPLATLHSILTAEQRQTFVDSGLLKQPGPGGPGGHAGPGGHPGAGPKGHFGGPGGHAGPGGPGSHPMMGQRPGMGERPDFPSDAP